MGTAISCEQFRDAVEAVKKDADHGLKSDRRQDDGRLNVFQRRSKQIASLNRMVTTEYVPEFEMPQAKL